MGACGYPQHFVDALTHLEQEARTKSQPASLILFSIDNLPMVMSGYSMAVAEAVIRGWRLPRRQARPDTAPDTGTNA